ncbi:unnamed protein product, partial [Ectocarpus sp. 13 AM-2016]
FSLDSRCLVADHPRSVQEEVESHFCPHCTSFFRTPDAMSTENRCPHCFECPCCRCVLVPSPVSLDRSSSSFSSAGPSFCLRCLYCQWTSENWGLVASDPAGLAAAATTREKQGSGSSRSSTAMVVGALLEAAQQRQVEADQRAASAAGGGGGGRGRDRGRGARLRVGSTNSGGGRGREVDSSLFSAAASTTGPWKVSDLDDAVARRNQVVAAASRSVVLPRPPAATAAAAAAAAGTPAAVSPPWVLRGDTDGPDPALWTLSSGHETAGLAERVERSWSSPPRQSPPACGSRGEDGGGGGSKPAVGGEAGGGGGVPRRVRLRARLGKRCRKDLAAGRTGILIKATFNPLDGDSSTAKARREERERTAGGEGVKKTWFKKDCSAALSVPRITVASLPSSLALLGPTMAVAVSKTAAPQQQGGREEDGHGGEGSEEIAGQQPQQQQQQQQQPSLVLRLANPQITLLRLRVATEHGPSTAESDLDGNTAAAAAAAAAVGVDETSPLGAEQSAGGGGDGGRKESRTAASASSGSPAIGVTAAAAPALAAGGENARFVTVRPAGWGKGDWVHLEGREDEIIRQPGDRYRLPRGLLSRADDGGGGYTGSPPGAERSGRAGATPFLMHQQGDVAWVRVPLDKACADRVAAAAAAAAAAAEAEALPVLDVRFSLVMGEGDGGGGDDISMPIAVRFPLSSCPS